MLQLNFVQILYHWKSGNAVHVHVFTYIFSTILQLAVFKDLNNKVVKFCNSEQLKQDRTKKLYLSTRWEPHLQIDGKFTTNYGNRIRYTQAGVIDQIFFFFFYCI